MVIMKTVFIHDVIFVTFYPQFEIFQKYDALSVLLRLIIDFHFQFLTRVQ